MTNADQTPAPKKRRANLSLEERERQTLRDLAEIRERRLRTWLSKAEQALGGIEEFYALERPQPGAGRDPAKAELLWRNAEQARGLLRRGIEGLRQEIKNSAGLPEAQPQPAPAPSNES